MKIGFSTALFLATPAIRAKLVLGKTDRLDHIVKPVVSKRCKMQLLANSVQHILILFAVGLGIFKKRFSIGLLPFKLGDHAARDKIHFGRGAREIKVLAIK